MSVDNLTIGTAPSQTSGKAVLAAFTLAIFTSAFLLFGIQPMFAKMVLPQLGGSPAVWSVAMVVFQALLLAGYAYAHVLTRFFSPRTSAIIHLALLAITALVLPIAVSSALGTPPEEGQALWLVGLFLASVGLPFFAVSGNGPLLQAWFARSGHAQAQDPYFLYGASNLGSFAALLLYPVLFEPLLSLRAQSISWSAGFVALIAFIALAALSMRNAPRMREVAPAAITPAPSARAVLEHVAQKWIPVLRNNMRQNKELEHGFVSVETKRALGWITLSFIPSGLLVAVTAHISTDVAAAPFLWVVPLALFLLTFVLIFRDKPLLPMEALQRALPILAGAVVLFAYSGTSLFLLLLAVHILFFFVATLVCHDRLYRTRPDAAHLTAFYLWMSFGGVLGGLFAGLLAPVIFSRVIEYPILVVLAVMAMPAIGAMERRALLRQVAPVIIIGLGVLAFYAFAYALPGKAVEGVAHYAFIGIIGVTLLLYRFPAIVAAALPLLFVGVDMLLLTQSERVFERSFFGVHKIETRENGQFRVLAHGTTMHGAMRIRNADGSPYTGPAKPLMYYHPEGAIAATLAAAPDHTGGRRIGVVGLGAGALACDGKPGDRWRYFEIDAAVARLAKEHFRFLKDCAPEAGIVLGDARLTLAREPAQGLDYLLIDAFSSDAIPMHLLTREALALYASRLAPNGVLALHISNRHMELESVVAALAKDAGLVARIRQDIPAASGSLEDRSAAWVVALARDEAPLRALGGPEKWRTLANRGSEAWSDDYSNIISAIWRHYVK